MMVVLWLSVGNPAEIFNDSILYPNMILPLIKIYRIDVMKRCFSPYHPEVKLIPGNCLKVYDINLR